MKSGFYLSCIMNREDRGWKEFGTKMNMLNLKTKVTNIPSTRDFSKELEDELRALKTSKNFSLLEKFKSILFVANNTDILPSDMIAKMRESHIEFSNILRVLPLDIFCKFEEGAIKKYIESRSIDESFKILYEGRLCPEDTKERIFKIILPLISCKVKLDNPKYIVSVQAYKNYVGVAVIKNDEKNFNFQLKYNS